MNYAVKREIESIAYAYNNHEIDRETAIDEVKQIARLEGDNVREAVRYFEKLED